MARVVAALALNNALLENECTRNRILKTTMTTTKTIKIIFRITSYVYGGKHQKYNCIFDIISIYKRNNRHTQTARGTESISIEK